MTASFYCAFEDRLRGSRELIKSRQMAYLPFIQPLRVIYPECPVIDLGCGRGEWLEILLENGFQAKGVDLDEGMLQASTALSLPAEQGEALATLQSLPDESQVVISGFHIAEHMPFSSLQQLVSEAWRVLKPAGLLILETPNAENLVVGTQNFYLDPTHERPIPHLLLSFLAEYVGFTRAKLLRLQEATELVKAERIELINVLTGVSPDYAIVAQKNATAEQMALFDQPFEKDYGLALDVLAYRYEQGLQNKFRELGAKLDSAMQCTEDVADQLRLQLQDALQRVHRAEGKQEATQALIESLQRQMHQASADLLVRLDLRDECHKLELLLGLERERKEKIQQQLDESLANAQGWWIKSVEFESRQKETQQQLSESLANAHHWYLQAIAHEEQVRALQQSTSWRITRPLRALTTMMRGFFILPARVMKAGLRTVGLRLMRWVLAHPTLRDRVNERLKRYPRLHAHLQQFARSRGLVGGGVYKSPVNSQFEPQATAAQQYGQGILEGQSGPDLSALTPRAREIFSELKKAIHDKGRK